MLKTLFQRSIYNLLIAGLSVLAGFLATKLDPLFGLKSLTIGALPFVGFVLLIGGVCIRVIAHLEFDRARITIFDIQAQQNFTTKGIYYYSRNPFYVGLVLQQFGAAFIFKSPAAVLVALAYLLFWHFFLLLIEEPSLAKRFGENYSDYLQTVPRWVGITNKTIKKNR